MNQHQRIDALKRAGMADNTRRAYERDVAYFWAWADKPAVYPVPVELAMLFALEHHEGLAPATERRLVALGVKRPGQQRVGTIYRRLKALAWAHRELDLPSPTRDEQIRGLIAAARRVASKRGDAPKKSKPITKEILDRMLATVDGRTLHGLRARAVLEFGFYTGGRRRSEIATAEMRHLSPCGRGYYYNLHRSKTDQAGKGSLKLLRSRYAGGLRRWLRAAGIERGYIFRGIDRSGLVKDSRMPDAEVCRIIKRHVERAGIDPTGYSAHGLRRGFITHCGRVGVPIQEAMKLTGHKDFKQALEYYEEGAIERNPATKI